MAGEIVMSARPITKMSLILPVDSEHNAIFQCLEGKRSERDKKSDFDCVWRSFPPIASRTAEKCHQVGCSAASDLENGPENHDRFGHAFQ